MVGLTAAVSDKTTLRCSRLSCLGPPLTSTEVSSFPLSVPTSKMCFYLQPAFLRVTFTVLIKKNFLEIQNLKEFHELNL